MDILEILRDMGIGTGSKLEGDAVPGDVRANKIFMNASGKQTGTLPVRATNPLAVTPGTSPNTLSAGIYDGDITVAGDANLVSGNIKANITVFGVKGKAEVVDTAEATNPAAASHIRSGKVVFINGAKLTGTLAVRSTAAETVTPGTSNIVKAAGIYDDTITILGDPDLVNANIKAGVSIFGVAGKNEVIDTTEAAGTAAAASHIRAGKIAFINGVKLMGTLAVRSTVSETITPGTADIVKAAGIYDDTITILGDPDLVSANIKSGVNIFGVDGAVVEATGDAVAADVLAGKKFSKAGQAGLTGTIPDYSSTELASISNYIYAGKAYMRPPKGYYSGGALSNIHSAQPDIVAANILKGKSIFGVAGTAPKVTSAAEGSPPASPNVNDIWVVV